MDTANTASVNVPSVMTRRYRLTVAVAEEDWMRSAVRPVALVNAQFVRSVQSALFAESCTVISTVPEPTENTWRYAWKPKLADAVVSTELPFVAEACVTFPAVSCLHQSMPNPVDKTDVPNISEPSSARVGS